MWNLFIYRSIFHLFVHPSFPSSIILSKCYLQYPFCYRRQRDALASSLVLITHSLTQSLSHQPIPSWFTRTLPLSIARSFTPSFIHSLFYSFIHLPVPSPPRTLVHSRSLSLTSVHSSPQTHLLRKTKNSRRVKRSAKPRSPVR